MANDNENFDIYDHPVLNMANMRIQTRPMQSLHDALIRLVWTYAVGAAVIGFSRAGKSFAFELLANKIKARNGKPVPVVIYSVFSRDMHTIKAMYEDITDYINLPLPKRPRIPEMKAAITMYIAERAVECGVKIAVFVIDEAQRLNIKQLDVFSELHDIMKHKYGIHVIMIFVGNKDQLSTLLKQIIRGENQHLQGRFFRQLVEFKGLSTMREVKECLDQYDTLRYTKCGPTYTEQFLPEEYSHGFRLSSLAPVMWDSFRDIQKTLSIDSWGIEHFIKTTSTLLSDYLTQYGVDGDIETMINHSMTVDELNSLIEIL